MREMKESGIEWIGEIPKEWELPQITHFTTSRSGGTPDRNRGEYWENGTIPWMSSGEVNKVNVYETNEKITRLGSLNSSAKILSTNSVMVALNGQGKTKGMCAILRIQAACNQSLCAFKCNEMFLHYRYLFYCFNSMYKYLRFQSGDNLRDGLAASFVKIQSIPLPSIKEQYAISDYLDLKCAELDALQQDIEKEIETLKAYKKSLITQAVSKGLNPHVEMKDSGIEWIGKINSKWKLYRLRYLLKEPLKYGASETGVEYDDTLPRYIRITDIQDNNTLKKEGKLSLTFEQAKGYLLTEETVLFARSGATVGKTFLYKPQYGIAAFAGYLIAAVLNKNKMFAKWLFYYTNSSIYWNWINNSFSQSTIQNIGADKYKNLIVVCPPIEEQNKIMHLLESKCAEIDSIIASKQKQSEILVEYKKSLIYELVTGKKEVPVHE